MSGINVAFTFSALASASACGWGGDAEAVAGGVDAFRAVGGVLGAAVGAVLGTGDDGGALGAVVGDRVLGAAVVGGGALGAAIVDGGDGDGRVFGGGDGRVVAAAACLGISLTNL